MKKLLLGFGVFWGLVTTAQETKVTWFIESSTYLLHSSTMKTALTEPYSYRASSDIGIGGRVLGKNQKLALNFGLHFGYFQEQQHNAAAAIGYNEFEFQLIAPVTFGRSGTYGGIRGGIAAKVYENLWLEVNAAYQTNFASSFSTTAAPEFDRYYNQSDVANAIPAGNFYSEFGLRYQIRPKLHFSTRFVLGLYHPWSEAGTGRPEYLKEEAGYLYNSSALRGVLFGISYVL